MDIVPVSDRLFPAANRCGKLCGHCLPRQFEHSIQHRLGQPSRECVLLAGMVRPDEGDAIFELGRDGVSESRSRPGDRPAQRSAGVEIASEGDLTERDNGPELSKSGEFVQEELLAVVHFTWSRLVSRWRAVDRRRDQAVLQAESVAGMRRMRLVRKARSPECAIEPVSGSISGKHTSRAVGAMSCRSQANDEQFSSPISETRYGSTPVGVRSEASGLFRSDTSPICDQTRTALARHDFIE